MATDNFYLKNLVLSNFGDIFISCLQNSKKSRIFKYSVNGKMLHTIDAKDEVTAMMVRDNHVLIGTSSGKVLIKELHR